MPIKFRCPNCRQFLGISRSKAGTLTDCPTCGHSIRVPALDGTVAPLPEPELNLRDAGLAKALDVLAQLDGKDFQTAQAAAVAARSASTSEPAAAVAVASVAAPLAPPVVAVTPPREISVAERSVPAPAPARSPVVESVRPKPIEAALSELGAVAESYPSRYEQVARQRSAGPRASVPLWLAAVGASLGIALGFVGGRLSVPNVASREPAPPVAGPEVPGPPAATEQNVKAAGPAPAPAAVVPGMAEPRPALAGRLTYTNENGESRPDEGARVLVFPETRQGSGKLPVVGFLAGAGEADYRLSKASLRVVGGDYAVADADGRYEISLPAAGPYQVLIISRYQDQKDSPTLENSLRKLLDTYFDRPNRLIGQVRYHFDSFRFDGAAPTTKGHGFTR